MNEEREHRYRIAESVTATGNPWIDDALAGGINMENMILVAAKTGVGKTFFGVQVSAHMARSKKRVAYFALEAEKNEIERRRLYYAVSRLVHTHYHEVKMPRYREWLHLKEHGSWATLEDQANEQLSAENKTLKTIYAHGIYTPEMFREDAEDLVNADEQKPDVLILDHLHHFFLAGDEIDALKTTIHQIKRLKDDLGIPILILAQLRKDDFGRHSKRSLPKLEDIRGTASLSDVATDVLIIAEVPDEKRPELPKGIRFPMYFHLAKSRTAPEARSYAGIVGYDVKEGTYEKQYAVAKIKSHEDPELCEQSGPAWATHARFPRSEILPPQATFFGDKDV